MPLKSKRTLIVNSLFFIFLTAFIAFLCWGLKDNFFVSDEWWIYAEVHSKPFWSSFLGGGQHYTPISAMIHWVIFHIFGFNMWMYATMAVGLHILNSFLVFLLAKQYFRKIETAIFISIFFACSSLAIQAITWFSTFSGSLGSTTFILVSLIFFIKTLHADANKRRFLVLTFIFALLAILTRENAIFLFLLYAIWWFIYNKVYRELWSKKIILSLIFLLVFFGYAISRYLMTLLNPDRFFDVEKTFGATNFWGILIGFITRIFITPLEGFWTAFLPKNIAVAFSNVNLSNIIISLIILSIFIIGIIIIRNKKKRDTLIFFVLFVFLAFTPFCSYKLISFTVTTKIPLYSNNWKLISYCLGIKFSYRQND